MYKAIILPLATKIFKKLQWYNKRHFELGRRFTGSVRKSVQFIASNPEATAIRYDNIRTILIDTFPYLIHFYIETQTSSIVIVAVLHTSQDPRLWKQEDS